MEIAFQLEYHSHRNLVRPRPGDRRTVLNFLSHRSLECRNDFQRLSYLKKEEILTKNNNFFNLNLPELSDALSMLVTCIEN